MTKQEEREELKIQLKKQLKAKVRKHRPAEKVLELEMMMIDDRLEMLRAHRTELEWTLGYLKELDPTEIETVEGSQTNIKAN